MKNKFEVLHFFPTFVTTIRVDEDTDELKNYEGELNMIMIMILQLRGLQNQVRDNFLPFIIIKIVFGVVCIIMVIMMITLQILNLVARWQFINNMN